MSNINIEDLKIKIEKFEKNRANQLKANKNQKPAFKPLKYEKSKL